MFDRSAPAWLFFISNTHIKRWFTRCASHISEGLLACLLLFLFTSSFFYLLFFSFSTQTLPQLAVERALVQIFLLLFSVVYFHKINLLNAVVTETILMFLTTFIYCKWIKTTADVRSCVVDDYEHKFLDWTCTDFSR